MRGRCVNSIVASVVAFGSFFISGRDEVATDRGLVSRIR